MVNLKPELLSLRVLDANNVLTDLFIDDYVVRKEWNGMRLHVIMKYICYADAVQVRYNNIAIHNFRYEAHAGPTHIRIVGDDLKVTVAYESRDMTNYMNEQIQGFEL